MALPGPVIPDSLRGYAADLTQGLAVLQTRRLELHISSPTENIQPICDDPRIAPAHSAPQQDSEAEIRAGMILAARRREEIALCGYEADQARAYARDRISPARHPGACNTVIPSTSAPSTSQKQPPYPALPDECKIWPLVGISAMRSQRGGAWRLWVLAQALSRGAGVVSAGDLRAAAGRLNVHPKTLQRWTQNAIETGLLRPIHRHSGNAYLIAGQARGALLLGCQSPGARPASVHLPSLFCKGWRPLVWAAYETQLSGPCSRACMSRLSGVPAQTQRDYEAASGTLSTPNYAISSLPVDQLAGFRENVKPHAFLMKRKGSRATIAWRLPDTRQVPFWAARRLNRGRTRKIAKALNAALSSDPAKTDSSSVGRVQGAGSVRIFHATFKTVRPTLRKLSRDVNPGEKPAELYERVPGRGSTPHCQLWQVVSTGASAFSCAY